MVSGVLHVLGVPQVLQLHHWMRRLVGSVHEMDSWPELSVAVTPIISTH